LPHGNENGKNLPLSSPLSVGIRKALEKISLFSVRRPVPGDDAGADFLMASVNIWING
jgi:hypothetical protein